MKLVVPIEAKGARLHDLLRERLICVPVNELGALVVSGAITVGGARARTDTRLAGGDSIVLDDDAIARLRAGGRWSEPAELPLDVMHEDAEFVVVDKPSGMHVHPLGAQRQATLLNAMLWHAGARPESPFGAWRPFPAHRLDRPASGLVAIAKSGAARDRFRRWLDDGTVERRYLAEVEGALPADHGTVDAPIGRDPAFDYRRAIVAIDAGGQRAVTHWQVRERRARTTLVELVLDTGRTHQIRVHLASLGAPIAGDTLYSEARAPSSAIRLHAWRLAFPGVVCERAPRWMDSGA